MGQYLHAKVARPFFHVDESHVGTSAKGARNFGSILIRVEEYLLPTNKGQDGFECARHRLRSRQSECQVQGQQEYTP